MRKVKAAPITNVKCESPAPGSIAGLREKYGNFFVPQGPWEKEDADVRLETITPREAPYMKDSIDGQQEWIRAQIKIHEVSLINLKLIQEALEALEASMK